MTAGPAGVTEASVIRTVEAIYDAAISPDRWIDALSQMRHMLGLCSAAFLVYNADRSQVNGVAACPDPDGHRACLQTIFPQEPVVLARAAPAPGDDRAKRGTRSEQDIPPTPKCIRNTGSHATSRTRFA